MVIVTSKQMKAYFDSLNKELNRLYDVGEKCRKKGYDPETFVEVKLARNMADRVFGLISTVAPQLDGQKLTKRIKELEKKYEPLDWRVALVIAKEVSEEKFCKFNDVKEAMEVGIRTGFAYHTVGIVSAPLEGFTGLNIKKRRDGKEYVEANFSGPIRGAGGTAASFCVLLTDFVRLQHGFAAYDPDEKEVERYTTELFDYNERVTSLQYVPSREEVRFIWSHLPVEISGDPTEKIEVSNYKDLDRIPTNKIRGGMALVLSMVALKAPKLWKRLGKWGKDFNLSWDWLGDFLKLQKKMKAKGGVAKSEKEKAKTSLTPNYAYISELVAGRPVFSFPLAPGGFRLRYGRSRLNGFSAASMNPATMYLCNQFIAAGTQLKVERPGKAAAITPNDSIEGPVVKLKDGSVLRVDSFDEAKRVNNDVEEILYLGDILFNYGDFSENGKHLAPPGYCNEWWFLHLKKAFKDKYSAVSDDQILSILKTDFGISDDTLKFFNEPPRLKPSFDEAKRLSVKLSIPLHPEYIFYWSQVGYDEVLNLLNVIHDFSAVNLVNDDELSFKLIIRFDKNSDRVVRAKRTLEILAVPHVVASNENIVLDATYGRAFLFNLGIDFHVDFFKNVENAISFVEKNAGLSVLDIINRISSVSIIDRAGTFVGARMGRPEKAKMRKMTGSPQVLFPVGDQGGRMRSITEAVKVSYVYGDFPMFKCEKCGNLTPLNRCEKCGSSAKRMYYCPKCKKWMETEECPEHGKNVLYNKRKVDIASIYNNTLKLLHLNNGEVPDIIKGVRGTSNRDHVPENIAKGIIRARHNVYVNKDGTIRYDLSELPLTHFKPKEIGTSIEKLKELGYVKDIHGKDLVSDDQILEIKPQDVILPRTREGFESGADTVFFNTANFVDELLEKFYGMPKYYNLKSKNNLVGHVVIGMAPHISSGMVGRIIGFSNISALLCSPLYHAALRRDCDGDEACILLGLDGLINFSRDYLPDKRGSRTMDAPLVLTATLDPSEVDDMVLGMDVVWSYPLEFYEAALQMKYPWDIKIEQEEDRIGKPEQYEGFGFTHDTTNLNETVLISAYKSLPDMNLKMDSEMDLARKIRASDEDKVAALIINKHLIKDLKGNLRKFSQQKFRCVKCNASYRRPPLSGKCEAINSAGQVCGGKIIFTISEGSVTKYLPACLKLEHDFKLPSYLNQTLDILQDRIDAVFGKDKEKQKGLGDFFS
ncbi:MAG: DNA polymerase II large subunit [Nitrospiraceae bacterium]|nr:DNA polymerase II large subunit [Nitrospiraceae bacterium]